jgi:hypothetical protein
MRNAKKWVGKLSFLDLTEEEKLMGTLREVLKQRGKAAPL